MEQSYNSSSEDTIKVSLEGFKTKPIIDDSLRSGNNDGETTEYILVEPNFTVSGTNGYDAGVRFSTKILPREFWDEFVKSSYKQEDIYSHAESNAYLT